MQQIVDTIASIWGFFTGLIENFILFFKYLVAVLIVCTDLITKIPSWLQMFAIITLTVSILYLILGRSTGGQKE